MIVAMSLGVQLPPADASAEEPLADAVVETDRVRDLL